ncbi:hypothetical protein DRF75_03910 [Ehrlichia minasensis]|uniref:Uncharacterized protein n=2 Tax=Ehrlichia minasensis TaxID=1242993 RepID=A0A4Q6I8Z5_9RICK|nr:hypothetical protein DRF75_03910 [Ehrlichia minasensis]
MDSHDVLSEDHNRLREAYSELDKKYKKLIVQHRELEACFDSVRNCERELVAKADELENVIKVIEYQKETFMTRNSELSAKCSGLEKTIQSIKQHHSNETKHYLALIKTLEKKVKKAVDESKRCLSSMCYEVVKSDAAERNDLLILVDESCNNFIEGLVHNYGLTPQAVKTVSALLEKLHEHISTQYGLFMQRFQILRAQCEHDMQMLSGYLLDDVSVDGMGISGKGQ